jgi:N6-adenosine-specific RNA methylase IME4
LLNKKYNIIYADVPWTYRDKAKAGNRGVESKYPVLSLNDLKKIDIRSISADNCALFFWATMPLLPEAFEVIKAWGFKFKTTAFVWIKKNKKADTFFKGMGHYTRANSELCLLATRGKVKRQSAYISQLVVSRLTRHSAKPPEVRDRIVQLLGDLPRIELFSRDSVEGWDAVGFDLDGKDIREVIGLNYETLDL